MRICGDRFDYSEYMVMKLRSFLIHIVTSREEEEMTFTLVCSRNLNGAFWSRVKRQLISC